MDESCLELWEFRVESWLNQFMFLLLRQQLGHLGFFLFGSEILGDRINIQSVSRKKPNTNLIGCHASQVKFNNIIFT